MTRAVWQLNMWVPEWAVVITPSGQFGPWTPSGQSGPWTPSGQFRPWVDMTGLGIVESLWAFSWLPSWMTDHLARLTKAGLWCPGLIPVYGGQSQLDSGHPWWSFQRPLEPVHAAKPACRLSKAVTLNYCQVWSMHLIGEGGLGWGWGWGVRLLGQGQEHSVQPPYDVLHLESHCLADLHALAVRDNEWYDKCLFAWHIITETNYSIVVMATRKMDIHPHYHTFEQADTALRYRLFSYLFETSSAMK